MVVRSISSGMSSLDAHGQARRYARILVRKTLGYCADREVDQLKRMRTYLLDLADSRPHVKQAQNWRLAAVMLDRQGVLFNRHYQHALQESMDMELSAALPAPVDIPTGQLEKGDEELNGMSLTLIDIAEVERILLLDRVSQRFNSHYETQLDPLILRLKVLFGSDSSASQHNPFRPMVFVRAFMNAWEKSGFDEQATEDVMLALDPLHSMDLAPLYADLTATLSQAGITPQSSASAPLPVATAAPDSSPAPLSGAGELAPSTPSSYADLDPESHRSGWGDLVASGRSMASQARQFLRKVGFSASRAADLHEQHTQPAFHAADPDLMGYLGQLQARRNSSSLPSFVQGQDISQQNVLRQLRQRDEVRGAPELDRGTVDTLAEVFDFVFAEQTIPMQMKVVIGRLQIPVLKAAMIDRDFFLSSDHPARKLVDSLALASIAWAPERGEQDPLYVRIETTVKRILTEFEDDLTLFSELLMEFSEFLFETEQQAQRQIEPAVAREQTDEALDLAFRHADDVISERIASLSPDRPLASFLAPFLTGPWCQVMAHTWLQVGADSNQWEHELKMLDHLIWSTQAKINAEERRQLVHVLPELVRHLNAGLDSIDWTGEERARFTKRLIATHTLAIRMTKIGQADSVSGVLEGNSSHAALKVLDQRRERSLAGQADEFDAMAQTYNRGAWFDHVNEGGKQHRCRLSWISPMRTRLLFTNRDGFDAFVRSEREVASMLRLGRLRVIDQSPMVTRALDRIMGSPEARQVA